MMRPPKRLSVYPASLDVRQPMIVYPGEGEEQFEITPETLIGGDKFDPITVMLAGRRGRGKTALLTFFGMFMREAFHAHNVDTKIAANYNTDVADPGIYCNPYLIDDLMEFPEWADDLIVLVDEVAALFPRRRSTARVNVDFSSFMQQIRKRDVEVIFTTQFPGMLDDQLLINIDLYCMCNMWPRHGWNAGKHVTLYIWDWHGQFTGKFARPRIPPDGPPTWKRTFTNVNRVFGHYNTKEVISRLWGTSQNRNSIAGQFWEKGNNEDEEEVAAMQALQRAEGPTDLQGFLESLKGKGFSLARVWRDAQKFDDSIQSIDDFAERVANLGPWEVMKEGKNWIAERRQE